MMLGKVLWTAYGVDKALYKYTSFSMIIILNLNFEGGEGTMMGFSAEVQLVTHSSWFAA